MVERAAQIENQNTENQGLTDSRQDHTRPGPGKVFLYLPGLRDAPPVGGGCCAITADDAVRDELDSWPAITVTDLDLHAERVTVKIDPAAGDRIADAVEALHDLGLNPIKVVRHV